jgi:hypothetical protein
MFQDETRFGSDGPLLLRKSMGIQNGMPVAHTETALDPATDKNKQQDNTTERSELKTKAVYHEFATVARDVKGSKLRENSASQS